MLRNSLTKFLNSRFITRLCPVILFVIPFYHANAGGHDDQYPFRDPKLPLNVRVNDLLSRMTPGEKISELGNNAPAIARLGLAAYNYWNEALHGVMAPGMTSFPQAIALSSSWDRDLIFDVATAISDEARAKYNQDGKGLTYWSPVINMARDPRWGRTEETYGEDPCLTAEIARQFISGMQGADPKYLKTVATVKHFACNNVEFERHKISSDADERSLREYYLPAFRTCVADAGVYSVMSAYNALNGVPCPVNRTLLTHILRDEWKFDGFVVSDCDAVDDVYVNHGYVQSPPEATALSIQSGTDLNCGTSYQTYGNSALSSGIMATDEVDSALARVFRARFLLGEFDPPHMVPYLSIPDSVIDCRKHRDLAVRAAKETIVLLKNQDNILPLNRDSISTVAVIGPNAHLVQLGGYSGSPVVSVTPLQGIYSVLSGTGITVSYAAGCSLYGPADPEAINYAAGLAAKSDVAIVVCGTDLQLASEERDRTVLGLPGVQDTLVDAVFQANPRTIVVLVTGFPLAINTISAMVPGIIASWYNGQAQGSALAEVLFGDYNPGGKLTATWYRSVADLPPMDHYDISEGRTYQYFRGVPLYPFGHGLSYTTFEYGHLVRNRTVLTPGDSMMITFTVKNTGKITGDEVPQLYIRHDSSGVVRPLKALKGFDRVTLQPGESKTVTFRLKHSDLAYYDALTRTFRVEDGNTAIMIGSSSDDIRLTDQFKVTGSSVSGTYRLNPLSRIEAENFEKKSKTLIICSSTDGGRSIGVMAENDYIAFRNVDFSDGVTHLDARIELDPDAGREGTLEVRLDSLTGPLAGLMLLNPMGGGISERSCVVSGADGIRDLFLVFKNSGNGFCRLNWFKFRKEIIVNDHDRYDIRLYPNPATACCLLMYTCSDTSDVRIEIYSLAGTMIRSYLHEIPVTGINQMVFNIGEAGLRKGMYIVRCTIDGYRQSLKLCVVD